MLFLEIQQKDSKVAIIDVLNFNLIDLRSIMFIQILLLQNVDRKIMALKPSFS